MAEEPGPVLQLPPATAAAGGEGLTEISPETATPEPPSSAAVSPGTEEPAGDTKKKIDILLKAVGDTPIMKTKKWAVERTRTIQGLIDFIKKFLKLMASEQLFIYVNQSFAPSPDQEVGTLYEILLQEIEKKKNVLAVMVNWFYITANLRPGGESQKNNLLQL
ncbi:ubiquitin-like protein ATG12 isoform X1 [Castor canadensis]|uniref:Ubiquitin-like protein ATG12 n=1 Tax=Castor canadensis TaxID=51338 RepID=A0A8B7V603_CASCN